MLRLCSQSPTRALILNNFNVNFIQSPVDFDEDSIIASSPKNFVYLATQGKFNAALKAFGDDDLPILVADSVVTANNEILRKAKDIDDARRLLNLQSNNFTSVVTCMMYAYKGFRFIDISYTDYFFTPFQTADLEAYLNSGEWQGKAGAIMVEGFCKPYIKEVKGLESTAMGLSIEKLLPFLEKDTIK